VDDEVYWRKDSMPLPVEYHAYPIHRDGEMVGTVVSWLEISERRQVEVSLRESEARHRIVLENAADAVLVADGDGRLVYANQHAAALLGHSQEADPALGWLRGDETRLRQGLLITRATPSSSPSRAISPYVP
jgi:PAS domain-containing protein